MDFIISILIMLGVITSPDEYIPGMENDYEDQIVVIIDEMED